MARVKDLWFVEVKDPSDPEKKIKRKTARHPDNGGSKTAKRWLAIWIGPDGGEKSKAFQGKENARAYGNRMEADLERGEYIEPKDGKKLLDQVAQRWLRLRAVGASSRLTYEGAYRLHVEPTFGKRQISSIRPSEILEWLRELGKTRGLSTQEMAYMVLSAVFDLAVADGMRKDNPAKSPIIPKPRKVVKEHEAWTPDMVRAVIDKQTPPYRAIPIVSAGCGTRQGETFGFAEDDFDFENGKVHIRRQLVRVGKLIVYKLPKGGKVRTAPLSPGVAREIKAHIEAHKPVACSLPWMNEDGTVAGAEVTHKLLFVWRGDLPLQVRVEEAKGRGRGVRADTEGKNLQTSSFTEMVWKPTIAAAGIIQPAARNQWGAYSYEGAREHGIHALRHWYVTTLLDAGVSLAGVMEFAGHSKKGAPVTLGVYGHVTEETFERARSAIDRSLFRLRIVQDLSPAGTETEQAVSG
jgi:integrase